MAGLRELIELARIKQADTTSLLRRADFILNGSSAELAALVALSEDLEAAICAELHRRLAANGGSPCVLVPEVR